MHSLNISFFYFLLFVDYIAAGECISQSYLAIGDRHQTIPSLHAHVVVAAAPHAPALSVMKRLLRKRCIYYNSPRTICVPQGKKGDSSILYFR